MVTLENNYLTVKINTFGAEVSSVVDKESGHEFVWQADETYWARHAPVLFPIVGRLKDDQYEYEGTTYDMSQHGFARDSEFEVEESTEQSATFSLKSTDETKEKYPFDFQLFIKYNLEENRLKVTYEVKNQSDQEVMYYGIGGHPAFNVSQTKNENGELEFDQVSYAVEPAGKYDSIPLTDDGFLRLEEKETKEVSEEELTHESFKEDALIYKVHEDTQVILKDEVKAVEIRVTPENMGHIGIWSTYPKRAGFVCVEPWAGLADAINTSGNYAEKYGINKLETNERATHAFTLEFTKKV